MGKRIVGEHFNRDGKPKRGYQASAWAKQEAARFGKTYQQCCEVWRIATHLARLPTATCRR